MARENSPNANRLRNATAPFSYRLDVVSSNTSKPSGLEPFQFPTKIGTLSPIQRTRRSVTFTSHVHAARRKAGTTSRGSTVSSPRHWAYEARKTLRQVHHRRCAPRSLGMVAPSDPRGPSPTAQTWRCLLLQLAVERPADNQRPDRGSVTRRNVESGAPSQSADLRTATANLRSFTSYGAGVTGNVKELCIRLIRRYEPIAKASYGDRCYHEVVGYGPRSLSGIRSLQPRINNLQTGDGS